MKTKTCAAEGSRKIDHTFAQLMELFALIGSDEKLFPKPCRTCGKSYESFADFVTGTVAKGHCLEDCSEVMGKPFTMMYRHCECGNTLVLSLTDEVFPHLKHFWDTMMQEAEERGIPLRSVVLEFANSCESHLCSDQD